jgi:hypothetical protein
MKNIQHAAFVVSIHYGNTSEVTRINVKWKGKHEISDFDFDRFGEVLSSESETENTGWVVVRSSYRANNSGVAPFQQSGPQILRLSERVSPGDEIPLL